MRNCFGKLYLRKQQTECIIINPMKHQEKKYKVDDFNAIENLLEEKGAEKGIEKTTMHYYADLPGNDVVKLVSKVDSNEIHILKESDGKFDLIENIPVDGVKAGLEWLKDKGYKKIGKVKMVNVSYKYKTGMVGLYVIDDWLYSVILDFPAGDHEMMEKEFGLANTKAIKLPYNKYLEKEGKLHLLK